MLKIAQFVHHSFGAIASGATVQDILGNVTLQNELVTAFNQHGLLILRNQTVTPSEELELAKLFPYDPEAPIEERAGPFVTKQWKIPDFLEVQIQGWGKVEDHYGISGTMAPKMETREWHNDGIHELSRPPILTQVYSISVPPAGGETLFMSGYDAWDALPSARRAKLGSLHVRYKHAPNHLSDDGTYGTIGAESNYEPMPEIDEDYYNDSKKDSVSAVHPLFRLHPYTGRVALYVAPWVMHSIDGMDEKDASSLVSEMLHLSVPGMYAHHFEKGDLVLWDNRCVLHSPSINRNQKGVRLIHRIRMCSQEVPVPAISADDIPEKKVQQLEEAQMLGKQHCAADS